jgi:hypothetical protein
MKEVAEEARRKAIIADKIISYRIDQELSDLIKKEMSEQLKPVLIVIAGHNGSGTRIYIKLPFKLFLIIAKI